MKFYNKAITLKKLKCKNAIIPKLIIITANDFYQRKDKTINKITNTFNKKDLLIARSSSIEEDKSTKSNAGKFESVLNVSNKKENLENAIIKVLNSYKKKNNSIVFVQKMISDCDFSGVITTCNLSNQAPYYVVNYYDGIDTSATTSGKVNTKSYYQFKYTSKIGNKKFKKVIKLAKELEKKFKNNYLDIEFGVKKR